MPGPSPQQTLPPEDSPSTARWLLYMLAPLLPPLGAAVVLQSNWAAIPAQFPNHWDLNGRPDGSGTRTPFGVFWPLIVAVVIVLCSTATGFILPRLLPVEQRRRMSRALLHNMLFAVACIEAFGLTLMSVTPLLSDSSSVVRIVVTGSLLCSLAILFYAIYASSPATAALANVALGASQTPDRNNPAHWRAYLIYFNPDDPSIWVPKRSGLGWTLNFAQPAAWFILAAILLPAIVLPIVFLW